MAKKRAIVYSKEHETSKRIPTTIQKFSNHNQKDNRFHPTQKPVALYIWLLSKYAKEGDRILDTHGGSMSSMLACHNGGFDAVCCELDIDYFNAGKERLQNHQRQLLMF